MAPRKPCCSPLKAAQLARDSFSQISWTTAQRNARKSLLKRLDAIKDNLENRRSNDDLRSLVKLLNQMYFRRKLHELHVKWATTEEDAFGFTSSISAREKTTIRVNTNHGKTEDCELEADAIIATVLHECVHSYLHVACCAGKKGRKSKEHWKIYKEELDSSGETGGHGLAYELLRDAVQEHASVMLGFEILLD
jgi:hypothetical protein